jgi:adenylate cyclase
MSISARTKRIIYQILPYGLIWLLPGIVFMLVETAAMGTPMPGSPTIIDLSWSVFLFACVAITLVGFLVGFVEVTLVEKYFRRASFLAKISGKFLLYAILMLIIITITYPIAASMESGYSLFDARVWAKYGRYLGSVTFLSTLLQLGCSLLLSVIYSAVSENLGYAVLFNLLTGKYHRPREEQRIFMFLDMKDSTTHAEALGNVRYFKLLAAYYDAMTTAIIDHAGDVYQYIGDEVIITWDYRRGLADNNCIRCFFALRRALRDQATFFQREFGLIPTFKAGIHLGSVTTGEIGALKKDIFFTGDVLNVTARIQGLCNDYQADFLASHELITQLHTDSDFTTRSLGMVSLKGRSEPLEIFAVEARVAAD